MNQENNLNNIVVFLGVLYESTGETFEQKKVMCDYSAKKYLALNSTLGPYLDIDPNLRHNLKV